MQTNETRTHIKRVDNTVARNLATVRSEMSSKQPLLGT